MSSKALPVIVAFPLLLQNIDVGSISTALPSIAASLQVDTMALNAAVTAYLISLAIFLPASGWLADSLGPKRLFCGAIAIFTAGSALCGVADTVWQLVACRILQGLGGALMLPVARLLLLRSVPADRVVEAMIWFTVPPAVGRMLGPGLAGLVLAGASWRFVFAANVVVGVMAIVLALQCIPPDGAARIRPPFDAVGFVLMALGLASLLAGLQAAVNHALPGPWALAMAVMGTALLAGYAHGSRNRPLPLVDLRLLRQRTFFASVVAGFPLRMAIGAVPYILPVACQLGFGLSPLETGLLMTAPAFASLAAKGVTTRFLQRHGFWALLTFASILSAASYASYVFFTADSPRVFLLSALLLGGLANSLLMVSLQALAYSAVPGPLVSHATVLSTMTQQVTASLGVLLGAALLGRFALLRGDAGAPRTEDFTSTIAMLGFAVLLSALMFARLPRDIGADIR